MNSLIDIVMVAYCCASSVCLVVMYYRHLKQIRKWELSTTQLLEDKALLRAKLDAWLAVDGPLEEGDDSD